MKRGLVMTLCMLFGLVGLALFGIFRFVSIDDLAACDDTPTIGECITADAVVVISGGDTTARTNEAIRLYQQGWAPKLIVSGAAQDLSGPSNAMAMKRQAVEAGIPANDILLDEAARDTNQNAKGVVELAKQQNIRTIILVTSPYHLSRASLVFNRAFAGFGAVRSHPSGYDTRWTSDWWLTGRGWWLVGSELSKVSYELFTSSLTKEVQQ